LLRVSSNARVNRGKLRTSFTPFAVNAICASTLAKRVTKHSRAVKLTWVDPGELTDRADLKKTNAMF
jgi:hypothetical protein